MNRPVVSRRHFLKQSTLTAGIGPAAPLWFSRALAAEKHGLDIVLFL
jgi:hypothetical protein